MGGPQPPGMGMAQQPQLRPQQQSFMGQPPMHMPGPAPMQSSPAFQASPQKQPSAKSGWTEHTAPDGRKYFYNAATKQSTWTKPAELQQVCRLHCALTSIAMPLRRACRITFKHISFTRLPLSACSRSWRLQQ